MPTAALLLAGLAVLAKPGAVRAQEVLTQQEALRMAFPEPAEIQRETAFLGDGQLRRARELAGGEVAIESGIVTYYVGRRGDRPAGVAYFDAHRVRTLPEVIMVVVDTTDAVERVEVLKFSEPPEYRAPEAWLDQFEGRPLDEELSTHGDIVNITGGTLTSRALTRAVRRVLALHAVIAPFDAERSRGSRREDDTADDPDEGAIPSESVARPPAGRRGGARP